MTSLPQADMDNEEHRRSSRYLPVLLLAGLILCIGAAGYAHYHTQKANLLRMQRNELGTVADLKAGRIANWYIDCRTHAEVIARTPLVMDQIRQVLENPGDSKVQLALGSWMETLRSSYDFKEVMLCDPRGKILLMTPAGEDLPSENLCDQVQEPPPSSDVVTTDLHPGGVDHQVHLSFGIPIRRKTESGMTVEGTLVLRVDPERFLFPLVQNWPTPSRTAETLLLRREGDEVVYLNQLRHRKVTALSLRLAVDSTSHLLASMAALGREGIIEGLDYRGVPVLGALRRIRGTPWLMEAKVDQEEIHAPLHELGWMTAGLAGMVMLASVLGFGLVRNRNRLVASKRELANERERKVLAERLLQVGNEALREKEALLKEVHHRVKNNLQIVSSLLNLQASHVADPELLATFEETRNRVRSMALLHEMLCRSENLASVNSTSYLGNLCAQIFSSFGPGAARIELWKDVADLELEMDIAVPCGLIINELVSNALKHAFPGGRRGQVRVELRREAAGEVLLRVADDGIGVPVGLDVSQTQTMGLQLVFNLAGQLGGRAEFEHDTGTAVRITFPA